MKYASLEVSKELFELSGWTVSDKSDDWWLGMDLEKMFPKYSLGYLLRKLPKTFQKEMDFYTLRMESTHNEHYGFRYADDKGYSYYKYEDGNTLDSFSWNTPEDAACKLSIELFKQGILKREG